MSSLNYRKVALVGGMAALFAAAAATLSMAETKAVTSQPKTVKIDLTVKETNVPIDNEGNTVLAWTYNGQVPGPLFRATEGDTIEFKMTNDASNQKSHSIDFHNARTDVLGPFAQVKPGETKTFTFKIDNPGIYFYHCGADPMIQHIARGMIGAFIVDPRDETAMPKADREYVLIEHQLFENPEDVKAMMANKWTKNAYNGVPFKYDPVHDTNATQTLEAKPGERVRIYLVNAGPNEFAAFHPIAGIWDKVYPSGNPKNVLTAMQNYTVGPGDAATFDIISPVEGANALVNHSMRLALSGGIAILMFSKDADPTMGRGDKILVR